MDKKEIEHRIKVHENAIIASELVIAELKTQFTEAENLEELDKFLEKPKFRHGDFGINKDGDFRLVINKTNDVLTLAGCCKIGSCIETVSEMQKEGFILGNVFDLMKGWDKPFEEYGTDKYATGIKIEDNRTIRIYACTGDCKKEKCSAPFFLDEAEDFYSALGHAIADLKRKENKNE